MDRRLIGVALLLLVISAGAASLLFQDRETDDGPFGGVDPAFQEFPSTPAAAGQARELPRAPDPGRAMVRFLRFVNTDIQRFWSERFQASGLTYQPTQLVIFRRAVTTGCGPASAQVGPFYCPADQRVYLDLSFFRELAVEFRVPGDFAQAYVVAHEIGHHIQALMGVTEQVEAASQTIPEASNELSIRTELMADCLAGVWAHSTYERGLLERGDLEEALRAAAAVGDDRIQARTQGRITPETWTHGSAEQRTRWLTQGFRTGDARACDDTFERTAV